MFLAAQENNVPLIKILLLHGADPTIEAYNDVTKELCSPAKVGDTNKLGLLSGC